jgi:hypothetical protein
MAQPGFNEQGINVMFGQSADYTTEAVLEQKSNQIMQEIAEYKAMGESLTPPKLRADAENLANSMRRFLLKYRIGLKDLDQEIQQLTLDLYYIDAVDDHLGNIINRFHEIVGKQLKFRARTVNVPMSEYHFLSQGYRSSPQKGTGSTSGSSSPGKEG